MVGTSLSKPHLGATSFAFPCMLQSSVKGGWNVPCGLPGGHFHFTLNTVGIIIFESWLEKMAELVVIIFESRQIWLEKMAELVAVLAGWASWLRR